MNILKKEKWWVWLLLELFSSGTSTLVLGALLDNYKKDSWYTKWYYWLIGIITIIPFTIMITVLQIQILCLSASKLKVTGENIYLSPLIWITLLIIPVFGWVLFIVLYLYLKIDILVRLKQGAGEKYI